MGLFLFLSHQPELIYYGMHTLAENYPSLKIKCTLHKMVVKLNSPAFHNHIILNKTELILAVRNILLIDLS